MPTLDESVDAETQTGPDLQALRVLSLNQRIVFTKYIRYVLPLDGYVFWLNTSATMMVQGSLHHGADSRQNEDETVAVNRVILTTGEEVQAFNAVARNEMWIGSVAGLRFAFSQQQAFYRAAGLYHYSGNAVYPALASQLVELGAQLPLSTQIVSNSLPAWLSLPFYNPIWLAPLNPGITLFPSFVLPDNIVPPYGSVHIEPSGTMGIQASPHLDRKTSHFQLASDHVRVTLYGATNAMALDFLDLVYQYSRDYSVIGMLGIPIVRDEKRTQSELSVLAMKKTIEFDVSYIQTRINDIARQLIEEANLVVYPQEFINSADFVVIP